MSDERFFCASKSRDNNESIYGTVAVVRSWLLLEHPGAWWRDAIEDSRLLSDGVKAFIHKLKQRRTIDRALLIRRAHTHNPPFQCFFVDSCGAAPKMASASLPDHDALLQARPEKMLGETFYAVCTHGRHDKCCAKFGIPVCRAFRQEVGERAWECSHVGGDRFAGNVVVFPYGIYYGRVGPEDVPEIVRRTEAGEVWLPGYRGRSCFRRAEQVGDYFARAESGRLRIDEFSPIETVAFPDGLTRVLLQARSDGSVHVVDFRTRTDLLVQRLTCESITSSAVPQHELRRYIVVTPP
jgi:hypothetical protein